MLQAGIATVDITPPVGIRLEAYSRPSPSTGVLDRLSAVGLALSSGGVRTLLLNVDNVGMLPADTRRVRELIAADLGLAAEQIMVCFTHTHSGPSTDDAVYLQTLAAQLREAASQAMAALRPARAGWGLTQGRIGMNRREKVGGRAVMGSDPAGPVDDRIGLLKVEDAETGRLMGLLVTCTAHGNVLKSDNLLISGDFPAWTRRRLSTALGCPVLVRIGAAGNVNALYRGTVADLELMAEATAGPVLAALPLVETFAEAEVWAGAETLPMPLVDLPLLPEAQALADAVAHHWGVDTEPWLSEVRALLAAGRHSLTLDLEVQLLRVGRGVLAGIPMEPFAETALAIAERLDNPLAFFGGYTNGWAGYLPTAEEFAYGGYEVDWNPVYMGRVAGLLMPAQPHVPELVADVVVRLSRASA